MASQFNFDDFIHSLNRKLEGNIKEHLKNVYTCVSISALAAGLGCYIHLFTNLLEANILAFLASVCFLLALAFTPDDGKNRSLRLGFLLGFAFSSGLCMGPLLEAVILVDPSIIVTAFLGTCVVFACFTICALLSDQRQYIYLAGTLMSFLSAMLVLSLLNLFIGSQLLFQVHLYLGLAVACGFIMYDTQLIVEKRRHGDRDFIWHSLMLFVDFIDVFRRLLVLLTKKERERGKK